jgi:hypothetical protein
MKGNLYKSNTTDKIYLIEAKDDIRGYVKMVCMHFPYTRSSVSTQSLKYYYTLIKPKGGKH